MKKSPKEMPAELAAASNAYPEGEGIRYNTTRRRKVEKRNQKLPGAWGKGGTFEFFKAVDHSLTDLADLRGLPTNPITNEVKKVRAARLPGKTEVWFHPAHPDDLDGIELKRYESGKLTLNLYDFLASEKLLLPVGRRERFAVSIVTDGTSPVGPSLMMDLARPVESKVIETKKKSSADKKKDSGKKTEQAEKKEPEKPATEDAEK